MLDARSVDDFRIEIDESFAIGKEKGVSVWTWPQMNISSVASEMTLLPCCTLARTASMMLALGMSICGFRSGTQN